MQVALLNRLFSFAFKRAMPIYGSLKNNKKCSKELFFNYVS